MWQIKNPELRPKKLDFGYGSTPRPVNQLFSEDTQLINVVELVEWNSADTQFLICEGCGMVHCKPGDWVSVRKADSLVLILPARSYVWSEKPSPTEYQPPAYLRKRGIPYFDLATYEDLRSQDSSFPALDQISPLSLREATLLFHWDAPYQVLGKAPEISVRRDLFAGSSEGDHVEYLQRLEDLLERQYALEYPAELRSLSETDKVISLYLDAAEFTEWNAVVFDGSEYRLLVASKYVVAPE